MFESQKRLPKWRQHCVKRLTIFLSKGSRFCILWTRRFCSNFTSMWSKCMERLKTSNVSISNGNIKFNQICSTFAVKTLPCYRCYNADVGSYKSLHTFRKTCLYCMLVEFEQNRIEWSKLHELLSFLTKNPIFKKKHFNKASTPF